MPTTVNYTFVHEGNPNATATVVAFVPTATGNTTNLNSYVIDPNGATWYIDAGGKAIKVEHKPAQLTNNDAPFAWNTAGQVGNVPKAPLLVIAANGETFDFLAGDGTPVQTYNPPFATTNELNTAINNYATTFNASQDAQDAAIATALAASSGSAAAISSLGNVERAWAKQGDAQATNAEAVLVTDNIFHLGKTKSGLSTDDGTERQHQVEGGISVNGNSRITRNRVIFESVNVNKKLFSVAKNSAARFKIIVYASLPYDDYISGEAHLFFSIKSNGTLISKLINLIDRDSFGGGMKGLTPLRVYEDATDFHFYLTPLYGDDYASCEVINLHLANNLVFDYSNANAVLPVTPIVFDSGDYATVIAAQYYKHGTNCTGINKDNPIETLDVGGNVQGIDAKFYSYVTLSDGKAKDVIKSVSVQQANEFIKLLPDAIVFRYKDDYAPQQIKGKTFVGFDAAKVEAAQLKNPDLFVPMTTATVVEDFDKDSTECHRIEAMAFGASVEDFAGDVERFEQAKQEFEMQKDCAQKAYEERKRQHEDYKQKWEGVRSLDPASIQPMLVMAMKGLLQTVAQLREQIELLKKKKK